MEFVFFFLGLIFSIIMRLLIVGERKLIPLYKAMTALMVSVALIFWNPNIISFSVGWTLGCVFTIIGELEAKKNDA